MKTLSSGSQRLLIFICHGSAITLAAPTPEPGGFLLAFFIGSVASAPSTARLCQLSESPSPGSPGQAPGTECCESGERNRITVWMLNDNILPVSSLVGAWLRTTSSG